MTLSRVLLHLIPALLLFCVGGGEPRSFCVGGSVRRGLWVVLEGREPGHGDVEDAVLLEPGADAAGVAALGDLELLAEPAPLAALELPLAADPQPAVVVDLHPQVLLLEPCVAHPQQNRRRVGQWKFSPCGSKNRSS
uniref:Uncharacterized protein n=1 Tax=Triticum urartu TaxID=4572 RepID=A0A8R7UBD1_TRIUA